MARAKLPRVKLAIEYFPKDIAGDRQWHELTGATSSVTLADYISDAKQYETQYKVTIALEHRTRGSDWRSIADYSSIDELYAGVYRPLVAGKVEGDLRVHVTITLYM